MFCFNRPVDLALAEKLNAMFVEVVFAPGYEEDALEVLKQKPNVRLLRRPGAPARSRSASRTSSACAAGC